MTSQRPTGDPAGADTHAADAEDTDDWWGGAVDPAPSPTDPSVDSPAGSDAGSDGDAAGADRASPGRSWWWLAAAAAAAAAVVVAVGVGVQVTRDDDSGSGSGVATDGNAPGQGGGPGGPGGFGGGTGGTITKIDPDALTLVVETGSGATVEVTATDDTTVSETVEGSADDLAVGDDVLVVGSESGDGAIAAEQVVAGGDGMAFGGDRPDPGEGGFPAGAPPGDGELPEGFDPGQGRGEPPEGFDPGQGGGGPGQGGGPGGFRSGTIESIDAGSLSVRTADDETVTVTLSSSTAVLVSQELSFDDLATGDEITVTGQGEADDGAVEAVVIRRGDGGFGFGGGFPGGVGPGGGDAGDGSTT
jgi:hypothetical protein